MCTVFCLHVYMPAGHKRAPDLIMGSHELPCGCWELTQDLWSALNHWALSLQPHGWLFKGCIWKSTMWPWGTISKPPLLPVKSGAFIMIHCDSVRGLRQMLAQGLCSAKHVQCDTGTLVSTVTQKWRRASYDQEWLEKTSRSNTVAQAVIL